ncbi:MAG TPA: GNAT family N-acetyltransferase, partial [Acidimicrobiia bacterium]|nr:GNAT family N-acetyltransferase [Acidimicrobiia bacterium]
DLCDLFGPNGAYSGCWCMWWRTTASDFNERAGGGLRDDLEALVAGGRVPGLLAYDDGGAPGAGPVGWISVAPRPEFGRLQRSPKLKPVDGVPVWSIVCFYIQRGHRGTGVATALLDAAVAYAAQQGAEAVEAYPTDPGAGRVPGASAFTGLLPMFERAGFSEIARRGGRPIVRRSC